jgi:hypothetical protein
MQDYVIDQVSWHTTRTKRKEVQDRAYEHMRTIVSFLQSHGLLKKSLLFDGMEIGEDFSFRKSDLTDEGFKFIQEFYSKWLNSHDHGKAISDTSGLERWLSQMRQKLAK